MSKTRDELIGKLIEQLTDVVNNAIDQIQDSLARAEGGKTSVGITIKLTQTEKKIYVATTLRGSSKWDVEAPEDSVDCDQDQAKFDMGGGE